MNSFFPCRSFWFLQATHNRKEFLIKLNNFLWKLISSFKRTKNFIIFFCHKKERKTRRLTKERKFVEWKAKITFFATCASRYMWIYVACEAFESVGGIEWKGKTKHSQNSWVPRRLLGHRNKQLNCEAMTTGGLCRSFEFISEKLTNVLKGPWWAKKSIRTLLLFSDGKLRMRVGFRHENLIDLIFRSRDPHLANIQPKKNISFFNFPIATLSILGEKEDTNKKVVKEERAKEVVKFLSFFSFFFRKTFFVACR